MYSSIPQALRLRERWIIHDASKTPHDPDTRQPVNTYEARAYSSFETACSRLGGAFVGIGFCLAESGFIGLDLDSCRDKNGIISEWALNIIDFCKSYTEISPSGTGVKIILRYDKSPAEDLGNRVRISSKHWQGQLIQPADDSKNADIMLATSGFFAMTGDVIPGLDELADLPCSLKELLELLGKPANGKKATADGVVTDAVRIEEAMHDVLQTYTPGATENDGSSRLIKVLVTLFRYGLTDEQILSCMVEYQRVNPFPVPFSPARIHKELGRIESRGEHARGEKWTEEGLGELPDIEDSIGDIDDVSDEWAVHHTLVEEEEEPDWIWNGYIAKGMLTIFGGLWKSGKSTFLGQLLRQQLRGEPFLTLSTRSCGVLYLSEEPSGHWYRRLEQLVIPDEATLYIRPREQKYSARKWSVLVKERLPQWCAARGIEMVVIDSMAAICPLEEENSNSEASALMATFQTLLSAGIAVVLVHHPSKTGGAMNVRGAGAFSAAADIIVSFLRVDPASHRDTRRRVEAMGRSDSIIPLHLVDFRDGQYESTSKEYSDLQESRQAVIWDILSDGPKTTKEIYDQWGERSLPFNSARGLGKFLTNNCSGIEAVGKSQRGGAIWKLIESFPDEPTW